jgi:hypothetical protein
MTTPTTTPAPEVCYITAPDGSGTTEWSLLPCHVSTWLGPVAFTADCCPSDIVQPSRTELDAVTVAQGQPPTLPETGINTNLSLVATLLVVVGVMLARISRGQVSS